MPFSSNRVEAVVTYGLNEVVTVNSVINDFIRAQRNSQVTFDTGASIRGTNNVDATLIAQGNAIVQINGGDFIDVVAIDNATVTIFGTGFSVNGTIAADRVILEEFGVLTGVLADGSLLDVFIDQNPSEDFSDPLGNSPGSIVLVTVPEPSSLALLSSLSLLFLFRRRIK